MSAPADTPPPLSWDDARRIEQWAGEARVNAIRIIALIAFYARHLADVHFDVPGARGPYHTHVTLIVAAWAIAAVAIHFLLLTRRMTPSLKYAAVTIDLLAITLLCFAADYPRPTLISLYFVIIASAPLRLSLGLVYAATLGAWAGYAATLTYYAWHVIGFTRYYATPELRIPRTEQAAWLLAMGAAGLLAGQVVRQARRLAAGPVVSVATEAHE